MSWRAKPIRKPLDFSPLRKYMRKLLNFLELIICEVINYINPKIIALLNSFSLTKNANYKDEKQRHSVNKYGLTACFTD